MEGPMKLLIVLIVLAGAGYLVHAHLQSTNPEVIETPVYAEFRVNAKLPGRDVDFVLFGEMASAEDCRDRADRLWSKVLSDCKECTTTPSTCRTDLEPRYRRLFEDSPIASTYMSFKRGNRFERNGRMVVYGLTSTEGDQVCESVKSYFQNRYEGVVTCILGRRG